MICIGGKHLEKKEFQKIVKEKLKELGFKSKGNYHHKIIDGDYLIGVHMEHHSFCKGYFIASGVIYFPDEEMTSFTGCFDYDQPFYFTKTAEDDLNSYDLEGWDDQYEDDLVDYFEYDVRSKEDLERQLDINIQRRMGKFYDKEYVFKRLHNDLEDLATLLDDSIVEKFIRIGDFTESEIAEVYAIRHKWEYQL